MKSFPRDDAADGSGGTLARLRHGLYRFFAAGFLEPDGNRVAALRDVSAILSSHGLERFAFFGPWDRLVRTLRENCDARDVISEYALLFSSAVGRAVVSLHESDFTVPAGTPPGRVLADLEGDYAALRLGLLDHLSGRPDHVSVEMEAMAALCDREAEARRLRSPECTARTVAGERRFLDRHLGAWFPVVAERVGRSGAGGLYPTLVAAAHAFIVHDRELVSVLGGVAEDEGIQ